MRVRELKRLEDIRYIMFFYTWCVIYNDFFQILMHFAVFKLKMEINKYYELGFSPEISEYNR